MSQVQFICTSISTNEGQRERALGEFLEDELHKRGIISKWQNLTDYGYVFTVTLRKQDFHIIIEEQSKIDNKFSISINSSLRKVEKFFGKSDAYEFKSLEQIIDDTFYLNSGFQQISWNARNKSY